MSSRLAGSIDHSSEHELCVPSLQDMSASCLAGEPWLPHGGGFSRENEEDEAPASGRSTQDVSDTYVCVCVYMI